jgi:hypothetical protein
MKLRHLILLMGGLALAGAATARERPAPPSTSPEARIEESQGRWEPAETGRLADPARSAPPSTSPEARIEESQGRWEPAESRRAVDWRCAPPSTSPEARLREGW